MDGALVLEPFEVLVFVPWSASGGFKHSRVWRFLLCVSANPEPLQPKETDLEVKFS